MFFNQIASATTLVRAGVGVIIQSDEGQVLLEKRSDCGLWGLPGGRIEPGESIVAAALREVKEETGLDIEITQLLGVYSGPHDRIVTYPDNVVQLIDVILLASVISGVLTCSSESEALEFFRLNALPKEHEIVPPAREPIVDFVGGMVGVIR
jgi:8-oxo-dGTP pyrophosphatase MutT (NUDIX family)